MARPLARYAEAEAERLGRAAERGHRRECRGERGSGEVEDRVADALAERLVDGDAAGGDQRAVGALGDVGDVEAVLGQRGQRPGIDADDEARPAAAERRQVGRARRPAAKAGVDRAAGREPQPGHAVGGAARGTDREHRSVGGREQRERIRERHAGRGDAAGAERQVGRPGAREAQQRLARRDEDPPAGQGHEVGREVPRRERDRQAPGEVRVDRTGGRQPRQQRDVDGRGAGADPGQSEREDRPVGARRDGDPAHVGRGAGDRRDAARSPKLESSAPVVVSRATTHLNRPAAYGSWAIAGDS